MGVRGLTTYILRQEQYLENYELPQNSVLVLDGNSVAANIFIQCLDKKSCFGGDYEIYAKAIANFFTMLLDSKITPCVLLDGAVEERKFNNVLERIEERLKKTLILDCTNEEKNAVNPLFLWPVFKDVIELMNIPLVICDLKCDGEVANIAKQWNCPVLSNDSDFFIFDVKFIPFFTNIKRDKPNLYVYRKLETNKETGTKAMNMYLRCKIFNREKFLSSTKLTKPLLPILAVYLGNDFIERRNAQKFFKHINIKSGFNFVEIIIEWLAGKTSKEAIEVMLNYIEENHNCLLKNLVLETVDNYECKESKYMKYLITTTDDELEDCNVTSEIVPKQFLKKFRMGFYHHHFLNILLMHRYFPKPLLDKIDLNHSHMNSFPILSAIHDILTKAFSSEDLRFYGRIGYNLEEQIIPKLKLLLPTYDQLQNMSLEDRINLFLDILNIKKEFIENCLQLYPTSWQILLITLKYISLVSHLEWSFIKSLILSKILISYIDKKIGLIRSWKNFEKYIFVQSSQRKIQFATKLPEALEQIDFYDSITEIRELIPYFEATELMKSDPDLFDRNLVHSMSEFQSCFLHINMLNDLFNRPFEKCSISNIFNGTFIYNVFFQLKYTNENFINHMLRKATIILNCFKYIINLLRNHVTAI